MHRPAYILVWNTSRIPLVKHWYWDASTALIAERAECHGGHYPEK